jgi:O-antigen ligase
MMSLLSYLLQLGIVLVPMAVVGSLVLRWFVKLEREDRAVDVTIFMLALLVFESIMWQSFVDVESILFHPGVGNFTFRLYEVLIPMALLARWVARRTSKRVGWSGLFLAAFFVFYGAAAVIGRMRGYLTVDIFYSAKLIAYLGGAYVLAAGVPITAYLGPRGIRRLLIPSGIAVGILFLTDVAGVALDFGVGPLATFEQLGRIGTDSASVFAALSLFCIGLALVRGKRSLALLLAAVPMAFSVTMADQRAGMLGMAVSGVVLVVFFVGKTARRRVPVNPTEVWVAGLIVGLLLLAPFVFSSARSEKPPKNLFPLQDQVTQTFFSRGRELSTQERVNQWGSAIDAIEEHPVLGWGLGKRVEFFAVGARTFDETPIFHDVFLDLTVRVGIVGLLLFVIAVSSVLVDGYRVWRHHTDDAIATFTLICGTIVIGLMAKGAVESIFEKYRLAVLLGFTLGMIRSAALSMERRGGPSYVEEEVRAG